MKAKDASGAIKIGIAIMIIKRKKLAGAPCQTAAQVYLAQEPGLQLKPGGESRQNASRERIVYDEPT
jgi:hypothetical protein